MKKTSVQKRPPKVRTGSPKQARNSPTRSTKPSRVRRQPSPAKASSVERRLQAAEAPPAVEAAEIVLSSPEARFAARVLPPEPERPLPARRRAIFFDVENTSRPEHISRVIDHLAVDWSGWRIDLIAVGNWKVIGRDTARLLARHGAHLIHSAPSVGVSDWSDLRIGVTAGVWLAGARHGDIIEIISNDRAFDAVGDVAASLGISFRRLTHQGLGGAAHEAPVSDAPRAPVSEPSARRRGGRGRYRRPWRDGRSVVPEPPRLAPPVERAPEPPESAGRELSDPPHTAPHDEIIAVVHDLMQRSPARPVTIDSLANALKARGFSRTPGSPRLITRLRRIKEFSLNRAGVITLVAEGAITPEPDAVVMEDVVAFVPAEASEAIDPDAQPIDRPALPHHGPRRRRSRRGGRRRRPAGSPSATASAGF